MIFEQFKHYLYPRCGTILVTVLRNDMNNDKTNMQAHPELNIVEAQRREPVDLPAQETPDSPTKFCYDTTLTTHHLRKHTVIKPQYYRIVVLQE